MVWVLKARDVLIMGMLAGSLAGKAAAEPAPAVSQKAPEPGTTTIAKSRTGIKIELKVAPLPSLSPKPKTENKSWPKTVPEAEAEKEAKTKPPAQWTPQEIAEGKARCAQILKRIHAVAIPHEPIKEGSCGTPAPIELVSIGQNPQVALDPPAIVNCDFAENLEDWIEDDVQPLARKHVGGAVIKIEVMSSYSCRNAYGRAGNKLSEHGLANALDIRGFVTAAGKTAYVLEDWGTPQREIAARIAAEKAKAAKELAAQQAAEKAAQEAQASSRKAPTATPPSATASSAGAPAAGIARSTISDGLPKITVTIPGGSPSADADQGRESFSLAPNRLGGPKENKAEAQSLPSKTSRTKQDTAPAPVVRKEAFLHEAHASACRRFGTTLGPEANAAHRNHLHVDMAQRKTDTKICD